MSIKSKSGKLKLVLIGLIALAIYFIGGLIADNFQSPQSDIVGGVTFIVAVAVAVALQQKWT